MELVELKSKDIYADSHLVARKFGYRHKNLVATINRIQEDLGASAMPLKYPPKVITEEREYRGARYTSYLMNRPFFTMLVGRLKGKKAFEWQLKFNEAFYLMEDRVLKLDSNSKDPIWLENRSKSVLVRREETDVIKEFVEYATQQGSKNAKFYYKHITNATYKALGLMVQKKPKLRDTFNVYELAELMLLERMVRMRFKKYMSLGRHYKDIYESVKNDILDYGSVLRLESK